MTASLRATATVAFLPPIFLTSRVPQALSADHRETRFKTIELDPKNWTGR